MSTTTAPADEALEILRGLIGVSKVHLLHQVHRQGLAGRASPRAAENRGVAEALSRECVVCVFKTPAFRPPPEPTVLLVDDAGTLLGRELIGPEDDAIGRDRRVAHLGKDFILFPGRRPTGSMRFLLPPVRFPELEGRAGIARVVSASPDPAQDEYLRRLFDVPPGNAFASVLIGFDLRNP